MRRLILPLLIVIASTGLTEAQTTIYGSWMSSDMSLGLRVDRTGEFFGGYVSIAKGTYKMVDGWYIRDHYKTAVGVIYVFGEAGLTAGLNYHSFGEMKVPDTFPEKALEPISFELGMTSWRNKFAMGLRVDVPRWEVAVDLGYRF